VVPFHHADPQGLDLEEVTYRFALTVAAASQRGFCLRDCRKSNWGFGLRNGRVVPLLLDGFRQRKLEF